MARRVRTKFKSMPRDVHDVLASTKGMTSTRALRRLKASKVKPIVSLSELRQMASKSSKRHGIPVRVSKDMTTGFRHADGVAIKKNKESHARIHPVLQYHDKRYVRDVIEHEIDHVKVMRKRAKG